MGNFSEPWIFRLALFYLAIVLVAWPNGTAAYAQDKAEPVDPFAEKCLSVIDVPIVQRDTLPVIDDYGKVRRHLVDQAAAEAIEQVVGMAIASDREVKIALHNEVADSRYSENMSGGSEGLVRTRVTKEEVINPSDGRFLSMEFVFSVCIPKEPKRPAVRITGTPEAFFDPATGDPKVWYWRSPSGDFEFFDNEGFHPGSGELLRPVSRDVINVWRVEEEKRKTAEQELLRRQAEIQEQTRKQAQMADRCDELAANPNDKQRPPGVAGVDFSILKLNAADAIVACRGAITKAPREGRFYYQLGRAIHAGKGDRKEAAQRFTKAIELGHVAAYDNLGHLLTGQEARVMFDRGVKAGDPSSMYSLAWILEPQGLQASDYVSEAQRSLSLYKRAGELGHTEAQQRFEELSQFLRTANENQIRRRQQDEQTQRVIVDAFGGFLNKIGR
jgi:hypothetical protein